MPQKPHPHYDSLRLSSHSHSHFYSYCHFLIFKLSLHLEAPPILNFIFYFQDFTMLSSPSILSSFCPSCYSNLPGLSAYSIFSCQLRCLLLTMVFKYEPSGRALQRSQSWQTSRTCRPAHRRGWDLMGPTMCSAAVALPSCIHPLVLNPGET